MKIGVNSRLIQNRSAGIPNYIMHLYQAILKIDNKNQYIFFQTRDFPKIGETKCFKLINSNLTNLLFDLFLINKLISEERIFHGPANVLPLFKKKGIKYVLTIHDLSFLRFPKYNSVLFNKYYYHIIKKSLKNADIVVADSINTKKDIIEFYNIEREKIKVVYLGVNNFFFENDEFSSKRIIKDKYIFTLTTHLKRKNIFNLLKAFAKSKKLLNLKLVISGTINKNEYKELKSEIKKLGIKENVIIFGFANLQELKSLYKNAEFFIYPSFYEGFGLPVLEAMATNCPVITSNTSSLVEIVPEDKWLVNPYSISDISEKMEEMLDLSQKYRIKLLKKNYEFAKKFTWDETAKKMIKIFEEVG